jgi:tRNA(adenine34) deaminase
MQGGTGSTKVVDLDAVTDELGMEAALDAAREGLARGELPIGAVVVADGRVVGRAHAEEVTQRRLLVHAELLALEEADRQPDWDRRAATLYTTLEPCLMCQAAAATAMVGRVVWALGFEGEALTCTGPPSDGPPTQLPHLHLPAVCGPVGATPAALLFQAYVDARADSADPFVRWAADLASRGNADA